MNISYYIHDVDNTVKGEAVHFMGLVILIYTYKTGKVGWWQCSVSWDGYGLLRVYTLVKTH